MATATDPRWAALAELLGEIDPELRDVVGRARDDGEGFEAFAGVILGYLRREAPNDMVLA